MGKGNRSTADQYGSVETAAIPPCVYLLSVLLSVVDVTYMYFKC
jgi:hypothetical protein